MAAPRDRQRTISPPHAERLRRHLRDAGLRNVVAATGYHGQTLTKAGCELELTESVRVSLERYIDSLPEVAAE